MNERGYGLRPITEADLELVRSWRNSDRVRVNMYTDHMITPEEHLRWFEKVKGGDTDLYLICEKEGTPVGVVYFNHIDRKQRDCEWGFYLGQTTAPKGTGTRMGITGLDFAFGPLGMRRVRGETFAFNTRGLAFHRRLGFVEVGPRISRTKSGREEDVVRFVLESDQWRSARERLLEIESKNLERSKHGIRNG